MTTNELKALIAQRLPNCGELKEYATIRERDKDLPFIPEYHFTSPGGYLNDPCGYCFYKGVYHMFYQFAPEGVSGVRWGHAVSADNLHWLDLPVAVVPVIETNCYSGGILLEEDRAVICYAGELRGSSNRGIHIQESRDDLLLTFKRISELPTVYTYDENGNQNPYNAFDPYIFKCNDRYCMITAGGGSLPHPYDPEKLDFRKEFLFTSTDLINWEYHHVFLENDHYCRRGDDGACPYFLPIANGKHMLIHYSHRQGAKYMIGRFDPDALKFYVEDGDDFNAHSYYSGVHAPSAFSDGNGGVTAIFNVNYGYMIGSQNMVMSLPRTLTIDNDGRLNEQPAGDIESLRHDHKHISLTVPANTETVLDGINGKALELKLKINGEPRQSKQTFVPDDLLPMVEVRVLRSPDCSEYTSIRFYRNRSVMNWQSFVSERPHWGNSAESVIEVDTSHSTLSPEIAIHPTESRTFWLPHGEPIELDIFVDRSIVEVFANGKRAVTVRSYATLPESSTVSVISRGVDASVEGDAWQMSLN